MGRWSAVLQWFAAKAWPTRPERPVVAIALLVSGLVLAGTVASQTKAAASMSSTRLVVKVTGLPLSQRPLVAVRGPKLNRRLRSHQLVLRHAKAGRYVVTVKPLRVIHASRSIKAGARALPKIRRIVVQVKRGRTTTVDAAYGTIINPGVTKLAGGPLRVVGDSSNPSGLVYPKGSHLPTVGAILVASPSSQLPYGLVARITKRQTQGSDLVLSITNLPVSAAIPEFSFSGALDLHPASRSASGRAAKEASCSAGPQLFNYGVSLDQFQIRQASTSIFPRPELSLEVAVRTTEHVGAAAAAASVSCNWTLASLGPWRAVIPTPIVAIPVYAEIPLTASASVGGSLDAFQLNLASTHDMTLNLGHYNHFSLQEQGSNIWTSTTPGWSGQAQLGVNLGVQVGVGDPKLANFHLDVGVGAQANFATDQTCEVDFIPGGLDAGVRLGPLSGTLSIWSATPYALWRGCGKVVPPPPPPPPSPLVITTGSVPSATVGTSYSTEIDVSGGTTPYAWSITSGSLNPGLNLDSSSGIISGTPTSAGTSTFTVTVTDGAGAKASQVYSIQAVEPPPSIGTSTLADPVVGAPYSEAVAASGGAPPYSWAVTSGSLNPGLSLDTNSGAVSGTATSLGTARFTITVTDALGHTTSQAYVLNSVLVIGTLGGDFTDANAVNDFGQVVGSSETPSGDQHAISWTEAGGLVDLGTLGGTTSDAWGVNDDGEVVGWSATASGDYHAFAWTQAGGMIDLGTLGGTNSDAAGINENGQVAGTSTTASGDQEAYLWSQSGGMVDLGKINDPDFDGSVAGLDNAGEVAGTSEITKHAFLWTQAEGMIDLGTLTPPDYPYGSFTDANAINGNGEVVGWGTSTDNSYNHAFTWTQTGGMRDLGTFDGTYVEPESKALAVNDNGWVVGGAYNLFFTRATVWTPGGGVIGLGTLSGYTFSTSVARAVSDNGLVIGGSSAPNAEDHGFAWSLTTGMIDLGTLGGDYSSAQVVSNDGLVIGDAYTPSNQDETVVWKPTGP